MRRLSTPLRVDDITAKTSSVNDWFSTVTERMNVYSGINDPVVGEIPENQWILYHNTTSGETRMWTNIAGVVKKSAAFT